MAQRERTRAARRRRVLLVGLTPLAMRMLEGPLSSVADTSAVPFPSTAFDRAVVEQSIDLMVVDVTYLDEARVRPVITHRLERRPTRVLFVSETGQGWLDDLVTRVSGPVEDTTPAGICALVRGPGLTLVS